MFKTVQEARDIAYYLIEGNRLHQKYRLKVYIGFRKKDLVNGRECCRCNFQLREHLITTHKDKVYYLCGIGGFTIQTYGTCKRFKKGIELNKLKK